MKKRKRYNCTVRGGHTSYPPGSFDFLAAYAPMEDAWYIIPEADIDGKESVALYPRSKKVNNENYAKYKEAWHLLKPGPDAPRKVNRIQACAEELPTPEFPVFWVEAAQ